MSIFDWLGLIFVIFFLFGSVPAQVPLNFKLLGLLMFVAVYVLAKPLRDYRQRQFVNLLKGKSPPGQAFKRALIEVCLFLIFFALMDDRISSAGP